ncbi:hypothetical protein H0H93_004338 [Arthromyces matolae]|nr:hypothetical protein H0H93_004338 [Arthromyces matolae]
MLLYGIHHAYPVDCVRSAVDLQKAMTNLAIGAKQKAEKSAGSANRASPTTPIRRASASPDQSTSRSLRPTFSPNIIRIPNPYSRPQDLNFKGSPSSSQKGETPQPSATPVFNPYKRVYRSGPDRIAHSSAEEQVATYTSPSSTTFGRFSRSISPRRSANPPRGLNYTGSPSQKAVTPQRSATFGNSITQSNRRVYDSATNRFARSRSEEQVVTYTSPSSTSFGRFSRSISPRRSANLPQDLKSTGSPSQIAKVPRRSASSGSNNITGRSANLPQGLNFTGSPSQIVKTPRRSASSSSNNITQPNHRVYSSGPNRFARSRSEEQVVIPHKSPSSTSLGRSSKFISHPEPPLRPPPIQPSPSSGPSRERYPRRHIIISSQTSSLAFESDYDSDWDSSSSTHQSKSPESSKHMKPSSSSTNAAQNARTPTSTSHEELDRRLEEILDRRIQKKRSEAVNPNPPPFTTSDLSYHVPRESSSMDNRRKSEELQRREQELLRKERRIALKEQDLEQRETAVKEMERMMQERIEEPRRGRLRRNTTVLLQVIFRDVEAYKRLLSSNKEDAQKVLDAFQLLLDTESFKDRTQLIAAMRRISERTELYPSHFFLEDAVLSIDDEPVISGGFSDVYKIIFRGEETCFKVIRVYQRSKVEHMAKVYAREAILWAQLSHPNILPFFGLAKFRSRLSFVTRWAQNGSLTEYLVHNPKAIRILLCRDTAAGVDYLHKNDIVHGDLKGANVLINSSGRASLGDFGLSSVTDSQIIKWTNQSTMASKGGTTRWQAPELLESEDEVEKVYNSKASDVFAWAGVCYEIFTGRLPYHEASLPHTLMQMITRGDTPTRPSQDDIAWVDHGLTETLWNLLMDCWKYHPEDRPDMPTVLSRLELEDKPFDPRPVEHANFGNEKAAMHFRNEHYKKEAVDLQFWEGFEEVLRGVVPGFEVD